MKNRKKETGPFCFQQQPVCATVASSYTEKRSGPRQLRSSPAKGSKVLSGGICCPLAIINSGNQTLAVLWLLQFRHQLQVTLSSNWTLSANTDTPGIVPPPPQLEWNALGTPLVALRRHLVGLSHGPTLANPASISNGSQNTVAHHHQAAFLAQACDSGLKLWGRTCCPSSICLLWFRW